MMPDVVVDVGNTRIKLGRVSDGRVQDLVVLPHGPTEAWATLLADWPPPETARWVVTGVHPGQRDALAEWLTAKGQEVRVLRWARELPLRVALPEPDKAGIDRLLDAVAVNSRRTPGRAAVVIDAGSAVTVDLVDSAGVFTGGAILPGLRLMAEALHRYTALLPLIPPPAEVPDVPGPATVAAMQAGVFWAVAGGVRALLERYAHGRVHAPEVYLTGGDAGLLREVLPDAVAWPALTLEGVRLAAEALPP